MDQENKLELFENLRNKFQALSMQNPNATIIITRMNLVHQSHIILKII